MTGRIVSGFLTAALLAAASIETAAARDLTFEERVRAQTAIERVYFSHQTGPSSRPIEMVYSPELMARKVRTYLAQSAALESIWKTPVTSEMLRRELERMAAQTRMPERLQELYQALGNDSFVIQECLARPALVDRMSRSFFASDKTIHAEARQSSEEIHRLLTTHRLDPWTDHPNRTEFHLVRSDTGPQGRVAPSDEELSDEARGRTHIELQPGEFSIWDALLPEKAGQIGPVAEEREAFVVRATLERRPGEVRTASYAVRKRDWDSWWQEVEPGLGSRTVKAVAEEGLRLPRSLGRSLPVFDPAIAGLSTSLAAASAPAALTDDTWNDGSFYSAPDPRYNHSVIWTGNIMIIWGGFNSGAYLNSGARYDPVLDTWSPTTQVGAPGPRGLHSAVWATSPDPQQEDPGMIIWGGYFPRNLDLGAHLNAKVCKSDQNLLCNDQGRCPNPTDTADCGTRDFPAKTEHGFQPLADGKEYLPDFDFWFDFADFAFGTVPGPRYGHMAAWVPSLDPMVPKGKLIIWGGAGLATMPVLNGDPIKPVYLGDGAIFDTGAASWIPINPTGAPLPRWQSSTVWTGDRLIIWGGYGVAQYLDPTTRFFPTLDVLRTGGIYDPAADSWTEMSLSGSPTARQYATAVWTEAGGRMLIWGGEGRNVAGAIASTLNDGAQFDPATNSWSAIASSGAPSRRYFHSAIWTGSRMIVWGGFDGPTSTYLNDGASYDPVGNAWSPISSINNPGARFRHTAIWTGSKMVVWGGLLNGGSLDTGGRYDPSSNSWTPTSTTPGSTPSRRSGHSAVWTTDSRMLIWGGRDRMIPSDYNSGSLYDPAQDTWTAISTTGAPSPRSAHSAVWTDGGRMLIWGGLSTQAAGSVPPYLYLNSGGLYDPIADSWTNISGAGAPAGRFQHSTIWTGTEMIVWGGGNPTNLQDGGRYNPATDHWTAVSTTGAPQARQLHTAVWTGSEMIVWGGNSIESVNSGSRYNPVTDSWLEISTGSGVPEKRAQHAAVWTGSKMLIWGGWQGITNANGNVDHSAANDGGLYDPAGDTWTPTSLQNAPPPAFSPAYVWTGDRLLVWGGATLPSGPYVATGGRYNPALNSWSAISTQNAPSPRIPGPAVWTGTQMLLWGGFNGAPMSSGGRYSSLGGSGLSTFFLDKDGDGIGDPNQAIQGYSAPAGYVTGGATDCNDTDLTTWATPSEASDLSFSDGAGIRWAAPSTPGAFSVDYDLLRTGLKTDFVSSAACVSAGTPLTSAIDADLPPPGQVFYYLVRARNGCPGTTGLGVLGFDSAGSARQGRTCE